MQAILWLAGALFYAAYGWSQPFVFGDEGYLYYLAEAVAGGQAPLRDFHLQSYMPGLFYAFSGPVRLAGGSIDLVRLIMVPWLAVTPVLALRCGWRLAAPPFAAAAAITLLLVPGPWTKFYVAGLSLLVLEAVLDVSAQPGFRPVVRAGAAAGLSLGLRVDVAIAAAVLMVLAIALGPSGARARRAACAAAAAALAWSPFGVALAARGVLDEHVRQLAGFLPEMWRRAGAGLQLGRPSVPLPWRRAEPFDVLFYASIGIVIALALVTVAARGRQRRARLLLLAWAVLSAPQYVWERPDPPHFTQRAFCFLLPLAVVANEAWTRRHALLRMERAAALATSAACAGFLVAYIAVTFGEPHGGAASALWRPRRDVRLSNGMAYWMGPQAPPPEMLERVLAQTRPGEPVASLPYQPGVNFVIRRPLPGRYVFLVPHTVASPGVERTYASELARARYVVYLPGQTTTGTHHGLLPAYAPTVAERLRADYEVEMEVGGYRLLRRADERSSP